MYDLNPADIIKEEDYEESIGDMSYRKSSRLALKSQRTSDIK